MGINSKEELQKIGEWQLVDGANSLTVACLIANYTEEDTQPAASPSASASICAFRIKYGIVSLLYIQAFNPRFIAATCAFWSSGLIVCGVGYAI